MINFQQLLAIFNDSDPAFQMILGALLATISLQEPSAINNHLWLVDGVVIPYQLIVIPYQH